MITLGIGELVAACVWLVPGWFGGEGGVPIDRASGAPFFAWTFGPGARGVCADRGVVRHRVHRRCSRSRARRWCASRTPCATTRSRAAAIGCRSASRALHDVGRVGVLRGRRGRDVGLINVELAVGGRRRARALGQRADRDGDRRDVGVFRAGRGCGVADVFQRGGGERVARVADVSRARSSCGSWWRRPMDLPGSSARRRAPRVMLLGFARRLAWMLAVVIASEIAYAMQFDDSGDGAGASRRLRARRTNAGCRGRWRFGVRCAWPRS